MMSFMLDILNHHPFNSFAILLSAASCMFTWQVMIVRAEAIDMQWRFTCASGIFTNRLCVQSVWNLWIHKMLHCKTNFITDGDHVTSGVYQSNEML